MLQLANALLHGPHVAHGLDDVAGAGLALGADHGRALADAPQRLPEVAAAAHEWHPEAVLVDVVLLVGRGEHLGLVDVVDLQRLEDLRLREVADAALRHDRDADRLLDLGDQLRVRHAGDAAELADVRRDAFERHHGHGARLLGDPRLVGGDDVHDHAAGEHARQPDLGGPGTSFDGGHSCFLRVADAGAVRRSVQPHILLAGRRPQSGGHDSSRWTRSVCWTDEALARPPGGRSRRPVRLRDHDARGDHRAARDVVGPGRARRCRTRRRVGPDDRLRRRRHGERLDRLQHVLGDGHDRRLVGRARPACHDPHGLHRRGSGCAGSRRSCSLSTA